MTEEIEEKEEVEGPSPPAAEVAAEPPEGRDEKPKPKRAPRKSAAAKKSDSPLDVSSFKPDGQPAGEVHLPEAIFGVTPHQAVMHQAYLRQVNNARQGTAATKTRAMVRGGGAKPYRQKGTGRARHGSEREPSMVGGGTVFGPQPRSFAQRMPRKMRRLALRSALSIKAGERRVSVLEGFDGEEPSTSTMASLLRDIIREGGVPPSSSAGQSPSPDAPPRAENTALLVLATPNDIVSRSANNLPWAKVILARNLNLYDLFTFDHLVVAKDALELLEETFAR
jgi:large subunit ribosomal protein L4